MWALFCLLTAAPDHLDGALDLVLGCDRGVHEVRDMVIKRGDIPFFHFDRPLLNLLSGVCPAMQTG